MAYNEKMLPGTVQALGSVDTFKHEPLTNATKEIRLFKLHTANIPGDMLRGTLETFDLEQCPEYLAVSYEWGALDTLDIIINHQRLQVRTNLWLFLSHLSRRITSTQHGSSSTTFMSSTKYLWIDQICIDQASSVERSHQVQLMSAIFLQAKCVVAWLGTEIEIEAYLNDETELEIGSSKFRNASYFSRLWVQQELLLAKQVFFAACDALLPWSHVRKRKLFYSPGIELPAILELLLKTNMPSLRLLKAIEQFSTCDCVDSRDKVYGLLGIVRSGPVLKIDYSLDPKQVLHETVNLIFRSETCNYGVERTLVKLAIDMGLENEVSYVKDLASKRYPFSSTGKAEVDRYEVEGYNEEVEFPFV